MLRFDFGSVLQALDIQVTAYLARHALAFDAHTPQACISRTGEARPISGPYVGENLLAAFVIGFVFACIRAGIETPATVVSDTRRKAAAVVAGGAAGMRFLRAQIDGARALAQRILDPPPF